MYRRRLYIVRTIKCIFKMRSIRWYDSEEDALVSMRRMQPWHASSQLHDRFPRHQGARPTYLGSIERGVLTSRDDRSKGKYDILTRYPPVELWVRDQLLPGLESICLQLSVANSNVVSIRNSSPRGWRGLDMKISDDTKACAGTSNGEVQV